MGGGEGARGSSPAYPDHGPGAPTAQRLGSGGLGHMSTGFLKGGRSGRGRRPAKQGSHSEEPESQRERHFRLENKLC